MESEVDRQREGFRVISGGAAPRAYQVFPDPEPIGRAGGTYSRSRSLLEIPNQTGDDAPPLRAFATPKVAAAIVELLEGEGGIESACAADFSTVRRRLIEACSSLALARAPGRWHSLDYGVFEALGAGDRAAERWHALAITPDPRLAAAFARKLAGRALRPDPAPLSTYLVSLVPGLLERRVGDVYLAAGRQLHVEAQVAPALFVEDHFLLVTRVPRRPRRFAPRTTSTEAD
ncbi:MAG: hypothetical protein K8H90_07855 [Thermoanaerobaculia bacterium]|nr:hypothetical protein [Thermoanaerobaculia bacterium]